MTNNRNDKGQFTPSPTASMQDRFERLYVKIPVAGCWIWNGALNGPSGYGAFKRGNRKSKVEGAHRIAWEIYVGPIPDGLSVLHRCDVPTCVNPHHLFLGTQADNCADKVHKNRQLKGIMCKNARITDEIARKIREMTNFSTSDLGEIFGVSRQSVADVRFGRTWKHV